MFKLKFHRKVGISSLCPSTSSLAAGKARSWRFCFRWRKRTAQLERLNYNSMKAFLLAFFIVTWTPHASTAATVLLYFDSVVEKIIGGPAPPVGTAMRVKILYETPNLGELIAGGGRPVMKTWRAHPPENQESTVTCSAITWRLPVIWSSFFTVDSKCMTWSTTMGSVSPLKRKMRRPERTNGR